MGEKKCQTCGGDRRIGKVIEDLLKKLKEHKDV